MAFNPSSTIYLCNVPIDNTYKHQIYFATATAQRNYFSGKVVKTFANYLTVRKTLPNGSMQSSVKVSANIDDLYNCNYMYYQNANHGTRYFYAFITNLIYVNEGTTEIVFETDVYQTWLFDVTLKQSYVVREHAMIDTPGSNIVPEKFNFSEYDYHTALNDSTLSSWGYLIGCTEDYGLDGSRGQIMSGIYQGLYLYFIKKASYINTFITQMEEEHGDCIVFICAIPEFCVSASNIIEDWSATEGQVGFSTEPAEAEVVVNTNYSLYTFDGFTPKNMKLYSYPFYKLVVSNHSGQEVEYACENFANETKAYFTMYGDVSSAPSITLVPQDYRGVSENVDFGISINGFPQCSFNTDTYKLWLAKNQYGIALDTAANIGQIVGGVVAVASTGGAGAVLGGTQIVSGVQGILSTINANYQASREPNRATTGAPKNNLLTAMKKNKFDFYILTLKKQYAWTIDNFFTMYGYQTNRVKVPNVSGRPCWNYVQTVDCNITGGIPADDMRTLKAMYNNGVTFWNPSATVGDYSQDNSILG